MKHRTQRIHPGDETWLQLRRSVWRLVGASLLGAVVHLAVFLFAPTSITIAVEAALDQPLYATGIVLYTALPTMIAVGACILQRRLQWIMRIGTAIMLMAVVSLAVAAYHFFYYFQLTVAGVGDVIMRYVVAYFAIRALAESFLLFDSQVRWAPVSAQIDLKKLETTRFTGPTSKREITQGVIEQEIHDSMGPKVMSSVDPHEHLDSRKKGLDEPRKHTFVKEFPFAQDKSQAFCVPLLTPCMSGQCTVQDCATCLDLWASRLKAAKDDPFALLEIDTTTPLSHEGMPVLRPFLSRGSQGVRRKLEQGFATLIFNVVFLMTDVAGLTVNVHKSLIQSV